MSRSSKSLAADSGLHAFAVDATQHDSVVRLFAAVTERLGDIDVVAYNAGARLAGSLLDLDAGCRRAGNRARMPWAASSSRSKPRCGWYPAGTAPSSSRVRARASKDSRIRRRLRWGNSRCAGWRKAPRANSGPKGIHVAHFIIDGAVRSADRRDPAERPDSTLDPDAIAQSYLSVLRQPRSAWSQEIDLRPWVERF